MNSKRFYYIMIGLTCLLGLAIVGATFASTTVLKQQSKKLLNLKLNDQVLSQQQVSLAKAKKDIAQYSELGREAKVIVPQDKDQAEAVREIVKIANGAKISLSSVAFPASTLGSVAAGSASAATPSPTAKIGSPITQTTPVPGLIGVYTMPITVQVQTPSVAYTSFLKFLSGLEHNRRTSQVSSVTIVPDPGNPGKVTFTLIINAYIKPKS